MPLALKAVGTQIFNSHNEPVLLRGVNAASLEWTSNGEGHILQSVNTAIKDWHVNIIRLPLAQDRWFGKGPEQKDEGVAYRALVKAVVDTCATQACYIVLDLHWSDCGEWGTNIAQHSMPDQNSVAFWKECAAAYRNHPAVIFDLYNEPHDVTWDIWLKGGKVTDKPNNRRGGPPRTYEAVGLQQLLDTVRATGAKNLVIAGGLDWAYDFSGILAGRQLSDPEGNGVLYANHAYDNKGHSVETWIKRMEQATAKLPVIVSEYGGSGGPDRRVPRFGATGRILNPNGEDWLLHVIQALQDHQWSWIAWDLHPAAGPPLISGWDYTGWDYTPTRDFGIFVKQVLVGTLPRYTPPHEPVYPLRVSDNRRYFTDQKGEPVFWLGTTQWQLFRDYTLEEARMIIENSKGHGFAFAQVMLLGVGDGTKPNVEGETPYVNNDPLTPNEAYFKHVDAVVRIATENNFVISMTIFHQRWRNLITLEKGRAWAKWIASRYKDVPNLVWSMTPEAKPEFVPVIRELAAGLHEGDNGYHLVTFKPDPAPHPPGFLHDEPWLDFSVMQVWKWIEKIYPMVTEEYGLKPVKPVVMGEGAYENGSEYGFEVTPLWVRRQAYYSYLAGAHHAYGHNDSWRVLPTWKQALDAPGATQLGILKRAFLDRKEWWLLIPDQSVFASDGNTDGQVLNLAARHRDGRWLMVYLASKASFSIQMNKLEGSTEVTARWINPKTGESKRIGAFSNSGVQSFSTPEDWEDALLILEP